MLNSQIENSKVKSQHRLYTNKVFLLQILRTQFSNHHVRDTPYKEADWSPKAAEALQGLSGHRRGSGGRAHEQTSGILSVYK